MSGFSWVHSFFLILSIMGMKPMCRTLPLLGCRDMLEEGGGMQGSEWERKRELGFHIFLHWGADTMQRGFSTPRFVFTISLSGGNLISIES